MSINMQADPLAGELQNLELMEIIIEHPSTMEFMCRWAERLTKQTSLVSIPQIF